MKKTKSMSLNFGPQHPAAHGVLRLILELEKLNKNRLKILNISETMLKRKSMDLSLEFLLEVTKRSNLFQQL